jgi:hypothetical protein
LVTRAVFTFQTWRQPPCNNCKFDFMQVFYYNVRKLILATFRGCSLAVCLPRLNGIAADHCGCNPVFVKSVGVLANA